MAFFKDVNAFLCYFQYFLLEIKYHNNIAKKNLHL